MELGVKARTVTSLTKTEREELRAEFEDGCDPRGYSLSVANTLKVMSLLGDASSLLLMEKEFRDTFGPMVCRSMQGGPKNDETGEPVWPDEFSQWVLARGYMFNSRVSWGLYVRTFHPASHRYDRTLYLRTCTMGV